MMQLNYTYGAKGGVGTSTFLTATAVVWAREENAGRVVLIDTAGDLPAILGLSEPQSQGVTDWLEGGEAREDDGLVRLAQQVTENLWLVPVGTRPMTDDLFEVLQLALAQAEGFDMAIIDCGLRAPDREITHPALLTQVLTNHYLSLRHAQALPAPDLRVCTKYPGSALSVTDVENCLGGPVLVIDWEASIARAVDAGLLVSRPPQPMSRAAAQHLRVVT